jgi:hypothetical protein
VIGEDDEPEPGARGGGGDLVGRAASVRADGVNVQHTRNGEVAPRRREDEVRGWQREGEQNSNGGHRGRR